MKRPHSNFRQDIRFLKHQIGILISCFWRRFVSPFFELCIGCTAQVRNNWRFTHHLCFVGHENTPPLRIDKLHETGLAEVEACVHYSVFATKRPSNWNKDQTREASHSLCRMKRSSTAGFRGGPSTLIWRVKTKEPSQENNPQQSLCVAWRQLRETWSLLIGWCLGLDFMEGHWRACKL
jgi:hypothetical protein